MDSGVAIHAAFQRSKDGAIIILLSRLPGCGKGCEARIKVGVAVIYIAFSFDPITPSAARVSSSWRNCGSC